MEWVDSIVGIGKFSSAMESVGWLVQEPDGLLFPKFGSHNTCGAERQRKYRERQKEKRNNSDVTRDVTRDNEVTLEKRREEEKREDTTEADIVRQQTHDTNTHKPNGKPKKTKPRDMPYSDDFRRFWDVFPPGRKKNKAYAWEAWLGAIKLETPANIIEAAKKYSASKEARGDYVRMPSTWLNGRAWEENPDELIGSSNGNVNGHAKPADDMKPLLDKDGKLIR